MAVTEEKKLLTTAQIIAVNSQTSGCGADFNPNNLLKWILKPTINPLYVRFRFMSQRKTKTKTNNIVFEQKIINIEK